MGWGESVRGDGVYMYVSVAGVAKSDRSDRAVKGINIFHIRDRSIIT